MSSPGSKPRVRLADIARRAGVSTATVSKVLTGSRDLRRILPATIERVRAAASTLGWTPTVIAPQRPVVVLASPFPPHYGNGIYASLHEFLLEALLGHGLDLHVCLLEDRSDWRWWNDDPQIQGVLVLQGLETEHPAMVRHLTKPVVLLNAASDQAIDQVLPDDAGGMSLLADHLWQLGHRRVVLVMEAMRDYGLRNHGSRHAREEVLRQRFADDGGCAVVGDVVSLAARLTGPQPPTAVVAYSSYEAWGALSAVLHAGRRVPEDLSIACGDYHENLLRLARPMTLVDVPIMAMARRAIELVLARRAEPDRPVVQERLPETLMLGGTTGQAPG